MLNEQVKVVRLAIASGQQAAHLREQPCSVRLKPLECRGVEHFPPMFRDTDKVNNESRNAACFASEFWYRLRRATTVAA